MLTDEQWDEVLEATSEELVDRLLARNGACSGIRCGQDNLIEGKSIHVLCKRYVM
jgi:hypothetical protein